MDYLIPDLQNIVLDYLTLDDIAKVNTSTAKKYIVKLSHQYFDTTSDMSKELLWVHSLCLPERNSINKYKRIFRVTDKQLKELKYEERRMPQIIAKKCFERHKTLDNLIAYKKKLEDRQVEKNKKVDILRKEILESKFSNNWEKICATRSGNWNIKYIHSKIADRIRRSNLLNKKLEEYNIKIDVNRQIKYIVASYIADGYLYFDNLDINTLDIAVACIRDIYKKYKTINNQTSNIRQSYR